MPPGFISHKTIETGTKVGETPQPKSWSSILARDDSIQNLNLSFFPPPSFLLF